MLKKNIGIFILFFYLLLIATYPINFDFSISIFFNTLIIIGIIYATTLLPKLLFYLLSLVFIIVFSINAIFSFIFRSWIWPESILNIIRTNSNEAIGVTGSILIASIFIIIITAILYVLALQNLTQYKSKIWYIFAAISLLYFIVIYPLYIRHIMITSYYSTIFKQPLHAAIEANNRSPILLGNIFTLYGAYDENLRIKDLRNSIKERELIKEVIKTSKEKPKHIFIVIGESSIPSHYSIYGYQKKTTPFLDSVLEDHELNKYQAISPHPTTISCLTRVFSFSSVGNSSNAYKKYTCINYANEQNYKTFWLSTQYPIGSDDLALGCIFYDAEKKVFINQKGDNFKLDKEIVPFVKEYFDKNEHQIFFIHLQGSHIDYSNKFDEQDIAYFKEYESSNQTENNYDRSIVHTDKVLKEIYNIMIEDNESILIYFSDHGEIIGKGHGFDFNFDVQYKIPFVTISRNQQIKSVSDSLLISLTSNNTLNTINNSLYLTQLMGFEIKDEFIEERIIMNDSVALQSGYTLPFKDIINK